MNCAEMKTHWIHIIPGSNGCQEVVKTESVSNRKQSRTLACILTAWYSLFYLLLWRVHRDSLSLNSQLLCIVVLTKPLI